MFVHSEGYRVCEVPVDHRPRLHGKSNFGWERTFRGALDLLTALIRTRFRDRPAHLIGGSGICLLIAGFFGLAYMLFERITGETIGDRPLLLASILFVLLGAQLIGIGLLAEIMTHSKSHPAVADTLDKKAES